jgi:hypothetical protein
MWTTPAILSHEAADTIGQASLCHDGKSYSEEALS